MFSGCFFTRSDLSIASNLRIDRAWERGYSYFYTKISDFESLVMFSIHLLCAGFCWICWGGNEIQGFGGRI